MRQIFLHDLLLQRGVIALLRVFVEPGEHPVPTIESDGSDAVSALRQKLLCLASRLQIASGVEIWMAKIPQLHFVLRQQHPRHALALNHFVFPILQLDLVQRCVAEGVVAEFESIVEPHLQRFDSLVDFSWLVELFLVDEADHRDFLVAQSAEQLRCHRGDFRGRQSVGHASGKIVDRDGDLTIHLRRLSGSPDRKAREHKADGEQNAEWLHEAPLDG